MNEITRRRLIQGAGVSASSFAILRGSVKKTDIRIQEISHAYEDYLYRTPIKFGGSVVDRATLFNVNCTVRTSAAKVAKSFGSMPLGNVSAFPTHKMTYDTTLGAMKALAEEMIRLTGAYQEFGHPIDINATLDPLYAKAASDVSERLHLAEPIPKLCTLVTASAVDAAVHDAFGKAHGLNCHHTYGPDFMTHDLAHHLGAEYKGPYPSQFISPEPK